MNTKTKTNAAHLRFIDANILFLNPENPRKDLGDWYDAVRCEYLEAHREDSAAMEVAE